MYMGSRVDESAEKISVPALNGLVLAGGKSQRMGHDKGLIQYHSKPQRYYLADLAGAVCDEVFISCRQEQAGDISAEGYQPLVDDGQASGQLGGILTALTAYPDNAWLVIACDLPHVDEAALDQLIAQRDMSKLATVYKNPENDLPEPLLAIWEPASHAMLLRELASGVTCPRKALIHDIDSVKLVLPSRSELIANANTPADFQAASKAIGEAEN